MMTRPLPTLTVLVAILALLGLTAFTRADAQAAPLSDSTLVPSITQGTATATTIPVTFTLANPAAPSQAAQTFTITAKPADSTAPTITGTASSAATNNHIAAPTYAIPIPAGTTVAASSLPATVTESGTTLTWTPGSIDGGARATVTITFQVTPAANSASSGGSH